MTYVEKLKDPRWQKKRLEVLERDDFTCLLCGDTETELHIHHEEYSKSGNPWDASLNDLATYCKHCHALVEYAKKYWLVITYVIKTRISPHKLTLYAIDTFGVYVFYYNNYEIKYGANIPIHVFEALSKLIISYA